MSDDQQLIKLHTLAKEMEPSIHDWTKRFGAIAVAKVLAINISGFTANQPDPKQAMEQFIDMLRKLANIE